MKIVITRPEEDAERFAGDVRSAGAEPVIAPLMAVRYLDGAPPTLDGAQALLFTSANGVRALARATKHGSGGRGLPVFAVGDATAAAARDAGFTNVRSAEGDVADLASLAAGALDPAAGRLLHVAGTAVAGDLAVDLAARGFEVARAVLYEMEIAEILPTAAADVLQAGGGGIALFSPRTADLFAQLVLDAGLAGACAGTTAFCLSDAVAGSISGLRWGGVRVAARPTAAALLASIRDELTAAAG